MRGTSTPYPSKLTIHAILTLNDIPLPIWKIVDAGEIVAKGRWWRVDIVARAHKVKAPGVPIHGLTGYGLRWRGSYGRLRYQSRSERWLGFGGWGCCWLF